MSRSYRKLDDIENLGLAYSDSASNDSLQLKNFNLRANRPEEVIEHEQELFANRRLHYSPNKLIAFFQNFRDGPADPQDEPPLDNFEIAQTLDELHSKILHDVPKRFRLGVVLVYLSVWFLLVSYVLYPQLHKGVILKNSEEVEVVSLSCSGDGYFWKGKNGDCALDGALCGPFEDREVIIKCPAFCDKEGWIYASTAVGQEMVKYRQFAIGGGKEGGDDSNTLSKPYRGDSYPCASALHSGVISPLFGGCVRLSFNGSQFSFSSTAGQYDTGFSVGFPSFFPSSFIFKSLNLEVSNCYDPRLIVLFLNVVLGFGLLFVVSSSTAYWILVFVGYWTVTLALDPPVSYDANYPDTVAELFSVGFQRLLPLSFILYLFYKSSVKVTLNEPSSIIWKLFGWYPMFWLGIANNITFDRLPVDRLTPDDIKQQPGGLIAIIFILGSIFVGIGFQIHRGWYSGKLYRYLKGYLFVILGLIAFSLFPRMQLRLHHYIIGLLLLPATATKNASAYLFQGVLLGLLISGVAKWDFASIVETNVSLLRGEAGSSYLPPSNLTFSEGIIAWAEVQNTTSYDPLDGYSLLINDIERYVGNEASIYLKDLIGSDTSLQTIFNDAISSANGDISLFVRVGRSSTNKFSFERGDYTMAGILKWPSGEWIGPIDGVS